MHSAGCRGARPAAGGAHSCSPRACLARAARRTAWRGCSTWLHDRVGESGLPGAWHGEDAAARRRAVRLLCWLAAVGCRSPVKRILCSRHEVRRAALLQMPLHPPHDTAQAGHHRPAVAAARSARHTLQPRHWLCCVLAGTFVSQHFHTSPLGTQDSASLAARERWQGPRAVLWGQRSCRPSLAGVLPAPEPRTISACSGIRANLKHMLSAPLPVNRHWKDLCYLADPAGNPLVPAWVPMEPQVLGHCPSCLTELTVHHSNVVQDCTST